MGIKSSIGKLKLPENYLDFVDQLDFERLDLQFEHASLLSQLDLIHRDPFDRLLIAQAIAEKAYINLSSPNSYRFRGIGRGI